MFAKADLLLELIYRPIEFIAGIVLEKFNKIAIAKGPNIFLHLSVLKSLYSIDHLMIHGELSDLFSPCSVDWIAEARMVSILDSISLSQYPLANMVKVINVDREPRNFSRTHFCDSFGDGF